MPSLQEDNQSGGGWPGLAAPGTKMYLGLVALGTKMYLGLAAPGTNM